MTNLQNLLSLGSISWIEKIHDKVPDRQDGEPEYTYWYVVHIEPDPNQQNIVQTIELTVTFGYLDEFLTAAGWSYDPKDIRDIYQDGTNQ